MHSPASKFAPLASLWREEWFLAVAWFTAAAFVVGGPALFAAPIGTSGMAGAFVLLFSVILGAAMAVVRHAEHLATRLGEPYGTLVLTLSVTSIEVLSISAVVLHGQNNVTLVRDSLLSVIMIVLNGMVGLALMIGAWRHREQHYNLQSANSYLGVIIPLAILSLVVPTFTRTTEGPTLSFVQGAFLATMSVALYGAFVAVQTGRHRAYFIESGVVDFIRHAAGHDASAQREAILLLAYMIPVVILAEQMAAPVDYFIETLHAPAAFGGLAMAVLVATPEGIGAVRAAMENNLQRAVNIVLGSALATIGLTVPAMLVITDVTGRAIYLGLRGVDLIMLLLTLTVSIITFASGRTNVLQGFVHLLLFLAYLLLMVQG
jgi:Ca2+:H+ antiporter